MRYIEQLKYSWSYNWGIFREIWDMFTLRNGQWLIVGLLVVLCVLPNIIYLVSPTVHYFVATPEPPFDPTLSQDIITDYYFKVRSAPSIPAVINYHWVKGSGFKALSDTLCIASAGLLLVAYLREGEPAKG